MNTKLFSWGIGLVVISLALSLSAYYMYNHTLRLLTLGAILFSLILLFSAMIKDLKTELKVPWLVWIFIVLLLSIYFIERMELPRFDFMIGDASDYFAAGMCSVTNSQDIGYILPLSATITAVGYDIFGLEYALLSHVIFYAISIPLFYFLFRGLKLTPFISFLMSWFLIFIPLSLWYAKSTFSETSWQILLFIFVVYAYKILQQKYIPLYNIIVLYILLFLAPMLRIDGVFYYGLLLFLAFYHFWKFGFLKSSLLIGIGVFVVAFSTQITLVLRPHYMITRQFSRVIPNATEERVVIFLYSFALIIMAMVLLLYFVRKWYVKINFPMIIVLLTIPTKMIIAYLYAIKKNMNFMDMFMINEYDLLVGNFGIPIAILAILGILILYRQALKGDTISLLLIVIYTIFYIPYAMQAFTFYDTHAYLFYWNRYYFSVFMIIHLFSFSLMIKFLYKMIRKYTTGNAYIISTLLFSFIIFISININLYRVVSNEGYLQNSEKLYTWVKKRIGANKMSLVTENSYIYMQNKGGSQKFGYLIGRMFSLYGINSKHDATTSKENLLAGYSYNPSKEKRKFVLCVSRLECNLINKNLFMIDKIVLPLEWREHFEVPKNLNKIKNVYHSDLSKSKVNHIDMHVSLYKVIDKFAFNKEIAFKKSSLLASSLLGKGWRKIVGGLGALASNNNASLKLPYMKRDKKITYALTLNYAILNASKHKPKKITFKLGDKVIKIIEVHSPSFQEYTITLPQKNILDQDKNLVLDIETSKTIVTKEGHTIKDRRKLGMALKVLKITKIDNK